MRLSTYVGRCTDNGLRNRSASFLQNSSRVTRIAILPSAAIRFCGKFFARSYTIVNGFQHTQSMSTPAQNSFNQ